MAITYPYLMIRQPTLKQFGKRLKQLRLSKSLSQEELAADCELSQTYLSEVECGKRNISLKAVFKIAKVLKVDVGELFPPYKN